MRNKFFLGQKGQSLVGVLVSVAVMGVAFLTMITLFHQYGKEMRAVNEKLSILELEKSLITTLADGKVCTFELTNPGRWLASGTNPPITFDASNIGRSNPPSINLNQILVSDSAGAPVLIEVNKPATLNANSAIVKAIQLTNFEGEASGNLFSAKFMVSFDSDKLVRPLKSIYIHTTLLTTGTDNIKTITGCNSGSAGGPYACVRFQYAGPDSNPNAGNRVSPFCIRQSDGATCAGAYLESGGFEMRCYPPNWPEYPWPGGGPWTCGGTSGVIGEGGSGYGGGVGWGCFRADGTMCIVISKNTGSGVGTTPLNGWNCYR